MASENSFAWNYRVLALLIPVVESSPAQHGEWLMETDGRPQP
jgi:hypothetical protein